MSLYALPGLLPPLSFHADPGNSTDTSSSASSSRSPALHLCPTVTTIRSPSDCQGARSDRNGGDNPAVDHDAPLHPGGLAGGSVGLTSSSSSDGGPLLASVVVIREARIDAARLIQALVLGTGTNKPATAASAAAPRSRIRTRPRISSSSAATNVAKDDELPITVQEECMEFELIIRLESKTGGCWSYETTRRLECFLELRRELVREFKLNDLHDDGYRIPPVPRVQNDEASSWGGASGNSGGGFVFLQALIRSYVPVLEAWLRSVLERLPVSDPDQSGALSDFLRSRINDRDGHAEVMNASLSLSSRAPVQARNAPYHHSVSPSQSNSSFRPLDSIEESEEVEC